MCHVKRSDYVTMLPQAVDAIQFYIQTPFGDIQVITNETDLMYTMTAESIIKLQPSNQKLLGNISAVTNQHIVVEQEITDTKFLSKTDKRYIPGVENTVYITDGWECLLYQYPFKGMLSYCESKSVCSIITYSKNSLILLARMALKKLLTHIYLERDFNAIHASAVAKEEKASIFIAGGRAGKSTIFMKLIEYGYYPINDDLVFLREQDGDIICTGFPILPSVRNDTMQFFKFSDPPSSVVKGFEGEFYIDVWRNKDIFKTFTLKNIYLPEYGHKELSFLVADTQILKKKLVKALSSHQRIQINQSTLSLINRLLKLPAFHAYTTSDMDLFAESFMCQI